MSDKELPEIEGGKLPFVVIALFSLVGLFFVGLFLAVLFRDPAMPPREEPPPTNVKEQPILLGAEDEFRVRFETTAGPFVVEVHPEWAPRGATQFRELVEAGFYDGCRFFRVVPGFVVQFGINGDPAEQAQWREVILDDPVKQPNTTGTMTFATSGPNTRTTQVFVNLANNAGLDEQGFSPFGEVVEGMENVKQINPEYRETPNQDQIRAEGNTYLERDFPNMDYIKTARIVSRE